MPVESAELLAVARALEAWNKSRAGERAGATIGFPRFKTKHGAARSVRFTTGAIRVEPDRHHVVLPRLGRARTQESTRKLARRPDTGTARILAATVRYRGGRWYCAFQVVVAGKARAGHARRPEHTVVGVDVGVRDLLVVATPDGVEVDRIPAPKAVSPAQGRLRALQRRAARQHGPYDPATGVRREPSRRWRSTQERIGRVHVRAADIRAHEIHAATTALARHHEVVVVEWLNVSGMCRRGGARKRGLNRALGDAALARIRAQLGYKTAWNDSASATPPLVGEWGPVPGVVRPPTIGLEMDVEPARRPSPPPRRRGRQEAMKRQPRTPIRRGLPFRKERLPEVRDNVGTHTSGNGR